MPDVYVRGKRIRLSTSMVLGEGGEAEVYDVSPLLSGIALKLWKQPTHPDFDAPGELGKRLREEVRVRLSEYEKKLRVFPKNLPRRLVVPAEFATDQAASRVLGYTMQIIAGGDTLHRYTQPSFRKAHGAVQTDVISLFGDLWTTVDRLHRSKVVIGDFNDLNVLVRGHEAYLIDADSIQFGGFTTRLFSRRFVDPLICDPTLGRLAMVHPHTELTDWYAYAIMFFESLLLVHPYGGTHEPKGKALAVPPDLRPLQRLTVFHKDVIYPARAVQFDRLPDELLQFYHELLERDERAVFPRKLLESLRWTTCSTCGTEHGRPTCPVCSQKVPPVIVKLVVRGKVRAEQKFVTTGTILHAVIQGGMLHLLYHEGGAFKREGGAVVLKAPLSRALEFRIRDRDTVFALGEQLAVVADDGSPLDRYAVERFRDTDPCFDSNARHFYWVSQGRLLRDDTIGPKFIGSVVSRQTRLWAGPKFGLGLYHANGVRAFLFDAEKAGVNDTVAIPHLKGSLVDAECVFSDTHVWLIVATSHQGAISHHCFVLRSDGTVLAQVQGVRGDGSWLGSFGGKVALTIPSADKTTLPTLFVATDRGLLRVQEIDGQIVQTAEFPDTRGLVGTDDTLLIGHDGLYVVSGQEVKLLTLRT